jgi:hypothetical protein
MGQKGGKLAGNFDEVGTWQPQGSFQLLSVISILIGNREARKNLALEAGSDFTSSKKLGWDASTVSCKCRKGSSQRREENLRRLGIKQSQEEGESFHSHSPQLQLQSKREIAESFASNDEPVESKGSKRTCTDSSELVDAVERIAGNRYHDSQLRRRFLEKLSYEGAFIPRPLRPPSHQTVIIFDWDDTLLCTSYLNYKNCLTGLDHLPESKRETLRSIDKASAQLIELASSLGQTFIITNALECWVEYTAKVWAPSLVPLLEKVKVVSARSQYEGQHPGDVPKWKEEAFKDVGRNFDKEVVTNLVSVGDSHYEMDAAETMGKEFQHAAVKLVKFRPQPSPEELMKQLTYLVGRFEKIVSKAGNHAVDLQWCV